jgi:hypothetical protein
MAADQSPTSAPRWARALDLLFLLLLLLAVVVAAFGGFRMRVADIRISITTPERIALWAFALTVVRHVLERRAPTYRDLPARVRAMWRLREFKAALLAFVSTRAAVLFVGYMAIFMFGYFNERPPFRVDENEALNLQARWDTGWYLGIAVNRYSYEPELAQEQQNIVFFPALPIAMRIVGRLFGGSTPAFLLGGTLIVLLAFLAALIYLYRFARDVLGDDERAQYAIWLLAAYPFAVFYSSVYTESLFLLGAVGAFYHFRRGELLRAGLFGLLVGLTRPNGCFLSIPLGLLAIGPWLPAWLSGGPDSSRPKEPRRLVMELAAAAMPGIGVLLYSAFIWQLAGDPLAWAAGHIAWGRSYQGLSVLVVERFDYISQMGFYRYTSDLSADLLHATGVIFVLAATWGVYRRLGLAYVVFILINILPPLAAGGLLSAGRFTSVLFPAFVFFAAVIPARHRTAWVAAFMAVQAMNAALFYTWRGMY